MRNQKLFVPRSKNKQTTLTTNVCTNSASNPTRSTLQVSKEEDKPLHLNQKLANILDVSIHCVYFCSFGSLIYQEDMAALKGYVEGEYFTNF